METDTYADFLKGKVKMAEHHGYDVEESDVNPILKPHQNAIVRRMVAGGCHLARALVVAVVDAEDAEDGKECAE